MSKATSPYYPPRARWYASLFYLTRTARFDIAFDQMRLPPGTSWLGIFGALAVPGLGFYLRGPRLLGRAVMAACAFLFAVFIVGLGYPVANIAFGLIVSTHVSGVVYYCNSFLADWQLRYRILFTVLVLMGVGSAVYTPLRSIIQNHWLMPVRQNGNVVILTKSVSARDVQRGEGVAYMLSGYRFSNHMGNGIMHGETLGIGPVLAVAGDNVQFFTNSFSVNGIRQALLPHMPQSGAFVVTKNHWFVWPTLNIHGNWEVSEEDISAVMLQLADVPENQFVGKPVKHWFWRQQIVQ